MKLCIRWKAILMKSHFDEKRFNEKALHHNIESWQNFKLTECQVDRMSSWQNGVAPLMKACATFSSDRWSICGIIIETFLFCHTFSLSHSLWMSFFPFSNSLSLSLTHTLSLSLSLFISVLCPLSLWAYFSIFVCLSFFISLYVAVFLSLSFSLFLFLSLSYC
jgi:hypothetical protein